MAELPGWDRSRLLTAASVDVEAARVMVYARAMEPTIAMPIAADLEVLDIESIEDPKRRERKARIHQSRRRADLVRALADQKRYRALLWLDEPDEADG